MGGFAKGTVASKKVFSVCLDDLISQAVASVHAWSPSTPSPWQTLPGTLLTCSTALSLSGALLAVGGESFGSSDIHLYQPSTRIWVKAGELPSVQASCSCTLLSSGEVFVVGGVGAKQHVDIGLVQ